MGNFWWILTVFYYAVNPLQTEKTSIELDGKQFIFDGFYILCHNVYPHAPQVSIDICVES